jgi:hypothetical protein
VCQNINDRIKQLDYGSSWYGLSKDKIKFQVTVDSTAAYKKPFEDCFPPDAMI